MAAGPLGRITPVNYDHVESHPLRAIAAPVANFTVNTALALPYWHWDHDQGQEGACVGHGESMSQAIVNTIQRKNAGTKPATRRYNPFWLWNEAKKYDDIPDTNPGDQNGTTVNAACKVSRDEGVPLWQKTDPLSAEGISAYRWATKVDEMRQAIAFGVPVTIGVDWYENFDSPEGSGKEIYIGRGNLGNVRGGHCVCIYGASDRRQAFRVKNSWGRSYPLVWLPYATMQKLLDDGGEAAIFTDR